MIGWLSGVVLDKAPDGLILDVGGVGYELSVPAALLGDRGRPGEELALWVHAHATAESPAATLFGFPTSEQRRVFRLLLKVKGVGPRLAQTVLAQLGGTGLVEAVRAGDVKRLTTVSGVGKKTAQQVILDLASQVGAIGLEAPAPLAGSLGEVASALTNLGFRRVEVDRALRALGDRGEADGPFDEVLRRALALLREA